MFTARDYFINKLVKILNKILLRLRLTEVLRFKNKLHISILFQQSVIQDNYSVYNKKIYFKLIESKFNARIIYFLLFQNHK